MKYTRKKLKEKKKIELSFLKRKNKETEEKEHFQQISSEQTRATGIDFISPSFIKETLPNEEGLDGRYNDYFVEIGATNEPVRYFRSFFAEIVGGNTWAGMLDHIILGEYGKGDVDLAIHIEPVDNSEELEVIKKRIRAIESDLMLEKDQAKAAELQDELWDLKDQQRRLRTNIEKAFRVSLQIVVSSNDMKTLRKFTNNLIRRCAGTDIILRSADGKQLEALLNITPLSENFMYKEHSHSFESSNVADFFPFGHGGISHRSGIVLGCDELGRPIYYDGWHPELDNAHGVILGRSGGGKTFATMVLTHRSAHLGIRTVIIDPKNDYRNFVIGAGCPYIDLAPDSKHRINFFDVDIEEPLDGPKRVNLDSTIDGVLAIVFKMIRVKDPNVLNGIITNKIESYVRKLYIDRGITSDPDSLIDHSKKVIKEGDSSIYNVRGAYKKMPQLGDLYLLLRDDPDTKEVAELLRNYTVYGDAPTQAIFDTQSNVAIEDYPIFAFGLGNLDKRVMQPIGAFIATHWQSNKFAKKNRHIRKRVIYDEAQTAMYEPEQAMWLENEFRTLRFFNTSIFAVTQGFEVFMRVPEGLGILKNAPTKIFFKQDPIDIHEVQGKFDLTEGEANFLLHGAKQGKGIIRVDNESSFIQIEATPKEFAWFNTNPNHPVLKAWEGENV